MHDELTSIQIMKSVRAELNIEKAYQERLTGNDVNYTRTLLLMLECWREHNQDQAAASQPRPRLVESELATVA